MYDQYSLILMLTHACNLRCSYCYVGEKRQSTMPLGLGFKAIDRALASLNDSGELQMGFFGGEPLLGTSLVQALIDHTLAQAAPRGINVRFGVTTNGTQAQPEAWAIMNRADLDLAVSCDGSPEQHDRHRHFADGRGSSQLVADTIRRLVEAGRDFRVITVVRPDTLAMLPESLLYLRSLGVRRWEPSLDLWTTWSASDESALAEMIVRLADLWRDGLPVHQIGWFDEKASHIAGLKIPPATRCGFGDGAVAVAPSGNLYPCERLIGQDLAENPMRLSGNAASGEDFLHLASAAPRTCGSCNSCAMDKLCNTFCRCSNYARTGDTRRPDSLLCTWNQVCLEQTARILKELSPG